MTDDSEWSKAAIADIVDHMNEDHSDALALYLQTYGGVDIHTTGKVVMDSIDATGIILSYQTQGTEQKTRILFADAVGVKSLKDRSGVRALLVKMAKKARQEQA